MIFRNFCLKMRAFRRYTTFLKWSSSLKIWLSQFVSDNHQVLIRNPITAKQSSSAPERELSNSQVETLNTGNETLTNFNTVVRKSLGETNSRYQLKEPSQINNETHVWTQILEQKNNDRIEEMREEMGNKFEAILREIKTNKNAWTITIPSHQGKVTSIITGFGLNKTLFSPFDHDNFHSKAIVFLSRERNKQQSGWNTQYR